MHHLLVSCFAFILSFGHAQTVRHTEANAFVPPVGSTGGFEFAVPGHHDLVSGPATAASYAGAACSGCNTTNSSSNAR